MATACNSTADERFGPSILCSQFDFTLKFEQSIFGIGISSLLLVIFPLRVIQLCRTKVRTLYTPIYYLKIGIAILLLGLQITSLTQWCQNAITTISVPAATIGVAGSIAVLALAIFEHSRTIRPSSLLSVYILACIIADALLLRTIILRGYTLSLSILTSTALAIKVLYLALESWPKEKSLRYSKTTHGPEEYSGIFSRSLFWWVNPIFVHGNKNILQLNDLFELDQSARSSQLQERAQTLWDKRDQHGSIQLVITIISCLRWELFAIIPPRFAAIAFNYAQPFLIDAAIKYLETPLNNRNADHAYGLIGATALIYLGIAISTAQYNRNVYRMITAFRGTMVSLIYAKTLTISDNGGELVPITLMSTDVDRVAYSLQLVNEIWARLIETSIGIYLLWRQLGKVSVAPVLIVFVCFLCEMWISRYIGPKQSIWVKAVQRRVATATAVLRSMRSVKMTGIANGMQEHLQNERLRELELARGFRWLIVGLNVVASVPQLLSPLVVFAAFSIQAKRSNSAFLSTAESFSSLAIISLLTSPAALLLGSLPTVAATSGCLIRIKDFLIAESLNGPLSPTPTSKYQERKASSSNTPEFAITLSNVRLGVFQNQKPEPINLAVKQGTLSIVTGSVGSGKSSLLKAMLGELKLESGTVTLSAPEVAYCSQSPWIPNNSIQACVLGNNQFDEIWYKTVIEICDLAQDLTQMPQNDQTRTGSRGIKLSGGQKHRITTRSSIMEKLFGSNGFCKINFLSTILVTHDNEHFRFADNLIVLTEGNVAYFGSPLKWNSELQAPESNSLEMDQRTLLTQRSDLPPFQRLSDARILSKHSTELETKYRQSHDFSVWKYYMKAIGCRRVISAMVFIALNVMASNFPKLWLKWNTQISKTTMARFIGVYAVFVAVTYASQGAIIWQVMISIVPKSGAALHKILVQSTMQAPMSFFDTTDSSIIVNRFSQDMTLVDGALPSVAFGIFMSLAQCFVQATLISLGSTYMALTIPAGIFALYFIQKYYLRTSRQLRLLDLEAKSPLYQLFTETLEGLVTIRAFGWQRQFNSTALRLLDDSQRPYYLLYCIQQWLNLVMDLLVTALAVVLVALALCVVGSSDAGTLGVALTSILAFNQTLQSLINDWTQAETSLGAISRTKSFEENTPRETALEVCHDIPPSWPIGSIEFSDLTVSYSNSPALQIGSLSIKAGMKIGICGRTGSGKSTMLSVLLRIIDPLQGQINIDGVDITTLPREVVRKYFICLPQDPLILSGSVRFNLSPEGNIDKDREIFPDIMTAALQRVGLWQLLEPRGGLAAELEPEGLSYGEQQLLAVARAIIRKQSNSGKCVLILDEATSNLDSETESKVLRIINEEFEGNTIISVAHRLKSIQNVDLIVMLDKGKILKIGRPEELLQTRQERDTI